MQIEMINHAGVLITSGTTGLLIDPWMTGSAFENGWELLSPTAFTDDDFERVTHIWFSHEHPDHFSVPSLRAIPEHHRRRITVLYQKTADRRVVSFCEKFFDDVVELEPAKTVVGDLTLLNVPHTHGDSYLWVDDGTDLILNVNDCVLDTEADLTRIAADFDRPPTMLLTQFSYANWCGNPDDSQRRQAFARGIVDGIVDQIEAFRPRFVLPFASFIWQSHAENAYMNADHNDIGDVAERIDETDADAVVLYPGDVWTIGGSIDNTAAISSYRADVTRRADQPPKYDTIPVDLAELIDHAATWSDGLSGYLGRATSVLSTTHYLRPVSIEVSDHAVFFDLEPSGRLEPAGDKPGHAVGLSLTSDAFDRVLTTSWGGMTLGVNGRFSAPDADAFRHVNRYFHLVWLESQAKDPLPELARMTGRRVRQHAESAAALVTSRLAGVRRA